MKLFLDPNDDKSQLLTTIVTALNVSSEIVDVSRSSGCREAGVLGIRDFPAVYAHGRVISGLSGTIDYLLSFPSSAPVTNYLLAVSAGLSKLAPNIAFEATVAYQQGKLRNDWERSWREGNPRVDDDEFATAVEALIREGIWPWA